MQFSAFKFQFSVFQFEISDFRFVWSLVLGHWSLAPALSPQPRAPRARRAASILEVLFAILVTTVGLLGAIAIFPVASSQARHGRINDSMAVAGRSAVHTFDTMGMRRPDRWVVWNNTNSTFGPVTNMAFGTCVCIDPRMVAASGGAAMFFPSPSRVNNTAPNIDPRMFRISLVSGMRAANGNLIYNSPMTKLQADAAFFIDDDLAIARPGIDDVANMGLQNDRSLPAVQLFDTLPDTTTSSKRQSQGHLSWMATLVPQLDFSSYPNTGEEYTLSIVVFYDRPADVSATDPLHERVVSMYVDGDGSTGGEVILYSPYSGTPNATSQTAANASLKLRPNDWVLLAGNMVYIAPGGGPPIVAPRFQWYRVTSCDDEATYETETIGTLTIPRYQIYATLMGQDWNISLANQQATIVEGVVGVYEKTVRLDYGSAF